MLEAENFIGWRLFSKYQFSTEHIYVLFKNEEKERFIISSFQGLQKTSSKVFIQHVVVYCTKYSNPIYLIFFTFFFFFNGYLIIVCSLANFTRSSTNTSNHNKNDYENEFSILTPFLFFFFAHKMLAS